MIISISQYNTISLVRIPLLLCISPFLLAQAFFPFPRRPSFRTTYARVKLVPASGFNNVSGEIFLEQGHFQGPVFIRGLVVGLEPGNHGFHVHAKGQISNDCLDAGGHFNPFKVSLLAIQSIYFLKTVDDNP